MTASDRDILLQTIASKDRTIAQLKAALDHLRRQIAKTEQDDDEYAALVEKYIRSDILVENITEAIEDDDPDRQTPGELEWHTSFDGLYNEMPY